ncbi:hypothetical protein EYF80_024600 [Liparis tanakae]|uniref:Uncharacterized protein n=1 Tax=Liparis tanakae TaxID=230148 RepID=A0A4Z2HJT7_9TELE|nr:hypothetical protein EYF80_024600 [Liparis tanakae]
MLLAIISSYNLQKNKHKPTPALGGLAGPRHWLPRSPACGGPSPRAAVTPGYSDCDPENASAALGWKSKQAGFPRAEGEYSSCRRC